MSQAMLPLVMMMVLSSSSALSAFFMMGGEEEGSDGSGDEEDEDGSDDSAGDEEDEDGSDDSAGDEEGGVGGHEWRFAPLTKIAGGAILKSINNASVDTCKQECENQEACVGFKRKKTGTKTCVLYSGDVSTIVDMSRHSYLLTRV
jgi:hypothetical protein